MMGSWGICIRYFLAAVIYSFVAHGLHYKRHGLIIPTIVTEYPQPSHYLSDYTVFWSTTYQEVGNTHKHCWPDILLMMQQRKGYLYVQACSIFQ